MSAERQPSTPALVVDVASRFASWELALGLEVAPGETVALVGPSGAGKSTALAIMAGLRRPQRGRIALGDDVWLDTERDIDRPPPQRRVGLVVQELALFPHLTVRDNVAYAARARGARRRPAHSVAELWLDRLGVLSLADRATTVLSGGERQRVALARALASQPRLLLLDEPFGALDVATRSAVRTELKALLRELRLPTVLVTHDRVDALALGDRMVVIERGHVTQVGSDQELRTHPRTPFIAELAGLNLYAAVIAEGRGLKEAAAGPVLFHVLADAISGPAYLAFAPAEVTLLSAPPAAASAQNTLAGTVRELVSLADRVRVVVEAGVMLTAEVTREAASALSLEPGLRVWASVKATAIRVYR